MFERKGQASGPSAACWLTWVGLLWASSFVPFCAAAYHYGTVDTLEPWQFTHRFCFVPTPTSITDLSDVDELKNFGLFHYTVSYKAGDLPAIYVYYDGFDSWTQVYRSNMTCDQRRELAAAEIRLWEKSSRADPSEAFRQNYDYTASGFIIFRARYDTYFFTALSNCQSSCTKAFCEGPIQMEYEFEFTNGLYRSDKHFSADEAGILEMDIVFFVMYLILTMVAIFISWALTVKKKFHHTVKLLCHSIYCQTFSLLCHLIHLGRYSKDGVGFKVFQLFGYILNVISEMYTLLLLILVAKGWTIVRRKISGNGRVKIAIYMTAFISLSIVTMIWAVYKFDEGRLAYYYESPPGGVLIALRFIMFGWFFYACFTTYRNYKHKRGFYRKFTLLFGMWLFFIPIMLIISIKVDSSIRAKFAQCWNLLLGSIAHIALLAMYNPSTKCNQSFPFHANTTDMAKSSAPRPSGIELMKKNSLQGTPTNPNSDGRNETGVVAGSSLEIYGSNPSNQGMGAGLSANQNDGDEASRLLNPEEVFWTIRSSGFQLVKGLSTFRGVSIDLDSTLRDWEGEEDGDVDFDRQT